MANLLSINNSRSSIGPDCVAQLEKCQCSVSNLYIYAVQPRLTAILLLQLPLYYGQLYLSLKNARTIHFLIKPLTPLK
jgi:hypothetical protein